MVLGKYRELVGAVAAPVLSHPQAQEEAATTLIVDLLHWLVSQGRDPDDVLDRAQKHYEAELDAAA
ncbi:hypothetical protein [Streptomyces sp. NPDC002722]|uniref:hypothetical protein n=1 Tax=unclassified Streptomyces TaxID=2593676 RepID=UPI00331B8BCF|nr:hypothetical protein OG355_15380 [Streptomyces sp. NBC_00987]